MDAVYLSADNLLKVSGLIDQASGGTYQNAATVTATVKNRAGHAVTGQTWPLTLTYVPASDGQYEGVLEDAMVLKEGTEYFCEVTADAGAGKRAFWRLPLVAQYATS